MQLSKTGQRGGFTMLEMAIAAAIVAQMALIAVPAMFRARMRSQASATVQICRLIDGAKDQWAIESNKGSGASPVLTDLLPYIRKGTKVYTDITASNKVLDALGNAITVNVVDMPPEGECGHGPGALRLKSDLGVLQIGAWEQAWLEQEAPQARESELPPWGATAAVLAVEESLTHSCRILTAKGLSNYS